MSGCFSAGRRALSLSRSKPLSRPLSLTTQVVPDQAGALPEFGAVFKRAGTYLVRATAGRSNIDGWPKLLQVLPGPVAPQRCTIRGGATGDKAAGPLQVQTY